MNQHSRSHLQRPEPLGSPLPVAGTLKRSVAARLTREFGRELPESLFRRALHEAESVAHSTGFPDLFFPALAEEKVRLVSRAIAPYASARQGFLHAA